MLKRSRNKLRVLANFLTGHCHPVKPMARIGLKYKSDCRFYGAEDKNPKYVASNCISITEICGNNFDNDVVDEGKIPYHSYCS